MWRVQLCALRKKPTEMLEGILVIKLTKKFNIELIYSLFSSICSEQSILWDASKFWIWNAKSTNEGSGFSMFLKSRLSKNYILSEFLMTITFWLIMNCSESYWTIPLLMNHGYSPKHISQFSLFLSCRLMFHCLRTWKDRVQNFNINRIEVWKHYTMRQCNRKNNSNSSSREKNNLTNWIRRTTSNTTQHLELLLFFSHPLVNSYL